MFDLFQAIFSQPLFNMLLVLYAGLHDLGLAILVLTLLIRLVLAPLSFKQTRQQQKQQTLQPQLTQLQRQYQGDQQGLFQAQRALFKAHQLSMFGGCLPLLLQLPIIYGLFYALQQGLHGTVAAINHQLYPFLHFAAITPPGGLHPLELTVHWFSWLPGHPLLNLSVADPTHVLPLLAAFLTFFQLRIAQPQQPPTVPPSSGEANAAAAQATSSAMGLMSFIGPLFTLWIGWHAAAGLALYWAASTLLLIGQHYLVSGWGGLFRGIPPLEQWARAHQARREARLGARRGTLDSAIRSAMPPLLVPGEGPAKSSLRTDEQSRAQ